MLSTTLTGYSKIIIQTMNKESLQRGLNLQSHIETCLSWERFLSQATVGVICESKGYTNVTPEESLTLNEAEEETLASLREAYLTVLREANKRMLDSLQEEFENL